MAMAFSVTTTSLRAVVAAVPARRPNPFLMLLSRVARPHLRLGAARPTRLPVPLAASFSEDPRGYGLERPPHDVGSSSFRMYVGNLSWRLDDSRLAQLFSEHGTVVFAKIMRDFQTGRSKGFGFVAMASQEERDEAIAALNGQILEGLALRVSAAEEPDVTVSKAAPGGARVESPPPRHVAEPSFRLHVSNLSSRVDDSRLAQMFSQHGKVAYTKVIRDFRSGRSKGFGFVEMSSRGEMDNAITALHGQSLEGRAIRVSAAEVPGMAVSKAAPGVESPPRHVVDLRSGCT
ncbi:28 kDa ribonucleoprotein, chloroplastic-like [Triticum dicoccoides]|uniref:28 kDa ribonucleoprotein, chloroplastic-like n=1 Tax=Triticum dicoccoides TaxID=85692 RepID=UPI001890CB39|nr:28 kDa ribonucleoprotein, chloroplastic-like [Triticum dicoccoides]